MRKIKFRAWHEQDKEMVLFKSEKLVNDQHQMQHLAHLINGDYGNVLMQYTGLKDKNGVEIYEGDILSEPTSPVGGKNGGYKYTAREIRWEGAGSGYKLFAPNVSSEVIGNIYENPELLEK